MVKLLIPSAVFILFFTYCNKQQHIKYLLPRGYKGLFAVVYSRGEHKVTGSNDTLTLNVPTTGICLTSSEFYDGDRTEMFLIDNGNGFDTVKSFLPKPLQKGSWDDRNYTGDTTVIAINTRQFVDITFDECPKGKKSDACHFEYELITVGSVKDLTKTDTLNKFRERLDSYLLSNFCCK